MYTSDEIGFLLKSKVYHIVLLLHVICVVLLLTYLAFTSYSETGFKYFVASYECPVKCYIPLNASLLCIALCNEIGANLNVLRSPKNRAMSM